jgi:hypothetical protein
MHVTASPCNTRFPSLTPVFMFINSHAPRITPTCLTPPRVPGTPRPWRPQHIEVPRLSKGHAADNLELLQWLFKFLRSEQGAPTAPLLDSSVPYWCRAGLHRHCVQSLTLMYVRPCMHAGTCLHACMVSHSGSHIQGPSFHRTRVLHAYRRLREVFCLLLAEKLTLDGYNAKRRRQLGKGSADDDVPVPSCLAAIFDFKRLQDCECTWHLQGCELHLAPHASPNGAVRPALHGSTRNVTTRPFP